MLLLKNSPYFLSGKTLSAGQEVRTNYWNGVLESIKKQIRVSKPQPPIKN